MNAHKISFDSSVALELLVILNFFWRINKSELLIKTGVHLKKKQIRIANKILQMSSVYGYLTH